MTPVFPELENTMQPASFPIVLSCLFMFAFIGCHYFYINWLYDFHGFLSLPALSERPVAVTGSKDGCHLCTPDLVTE